MTSDQTKSIGLALTLISNLIMIFMTPWTGIETTWGNTVRWVAILIGMIGVVFIAMFWFFKRKNK
jgi:type IV secretory pathway TrbL component